MEVEPSLFVKERSAPRDHKGPCHPRNHVFVRVYLHKLRSIPELLMPIHWEIEDGKTKLRMVKQMVMASKSDASKQI